MAQPTTRLLTALGYAVDLTARRCFFTSPVYDARGRCIEKTSASAAAAATAALPHRLLRLLLHLLSAYVEKSFG